MVTRVLTPLIVSPSKYSLFFTHGVRFLCLCDVEIYREIAGLNLILRCNIQGSQIRRNANKSNISIRFILISWYLLSRLLDVKLGDIVSVFWLWISLFSTMSTALAALGLVYFNLNVKQFRPDIGWRHTLCAFAMHNKIQLFSKFYFLLRLNNHSK